MRFDFLRCSISGCGASAIINIKNVSIARVIFSSYVNWLIQVLDIARCTFCCIFYNRQVIFAGCEDHIREKLAQKVLIWNVDKLSYIRICAYYSVQDYSQNFAVWGLQHIFLYDIVMSRFRDVTSFEKRLQKARVLSIYVSVFDNMGVWTMHFISAAGNSDLKILVA